MPIRNIQGLVDKKGLSYLENGNIVDTYYNEALANLGQRNTNDSLLESVTFTIGDVFSNLNNYLTIPNIDPYVYVIYYDDAPDPTNDLHVGHFYTLVKQKIDDQYEINDFMDMDVNDIKDIVSLIETNNIESLIENGYIKELNVVPNRSTDNSYTIVKKQLSIIISIFDTIATNNSIHRDRMIIPLNYEFGYLANGINKSFIYHSFKDVYVNVIPVDFTNTEDDYELESMDFYKSNIFYCKLEQKFIKTDVYEYVFKTINNKEDIYSSLKFTLPYINSNDYWVINNQETSIQAKAHDAVNLNIILAYYYKAGNTPIYKFLSGLNSNIKTNTITYQTEQEATRFSIKNGEDIIRCVLQTPLIDGSNLTKENIKLNVVLRNSTLIIVSKITDILSEGTNIEKFGDGFVTTMWRCVPDTNVNYDNWDESDTNWHYECICIEDDVALDLNQLTNFDNLLKYEVKNVKQIEPDNFLHTQLVFDQIYQQLKQDNNKPIYSYPVLQNIKGSQYNNKYGNNMNFSLKYINYISGEIGKDIKGVSKSSDTKYLKNNNGISSGGTVTNSLYQYVENNKVNYYNEYIPNYNIPLFDMSEFLIKDSNVLNKYNILTVDYDGTTYYSYIGTSHNTTKDTLTIGSSNLNINLGENTLTDYNTKKSFSKQKTINIDFNKINANGKLNVRNDLEVGGNIKLKNFEWSINTINNVEMQSTSFIPQFKYYSLNSNGQLYKLININNIENDIKNLKTAAEYIGLPFGTEESKQYLYICPIIYVEHSAQNYMPYYYKYNDLLVLPNLAKYLGFNPADITNYESNTNDIITVKNEQLYLVSSNNILADSISIVSSTDTGVTIDLLNNKEFYLGNMLYVTYVELNNQKKLIINEVQSNKIKSIWKIPTNIN